MKVRFKNYQYIRLIQEFEVALNGYLAIKDAGGSIKVDPNSPYAISMISMFLLLGLENMMCGYVLKNSADYKEIKTLYDEVIKNTSDLMKDMEANDPISIFSTYVYMQRNGYFSKEHENAYNMDLHDMNNLMGADVINSSGVCRSYASMLRDIYNYMGFDSSVITVFATPENINDFKKLSVVPKKISDESTKKKVDKIVKLTKLLHLGNHAITIVKDNDKNYTLDPTNDGFIIPNKAHNLLTSDNPTSSMKYRSLSTLMFKRNLLAVRKQLMMPTITREEYEKIYLVMQDRMDRNKDLMEKFYSENKELYDEISEKIKNTGSTISRIYPMAGLFYDNQKTITEKLDQLEEKISKKM